jgi:ribonuclease inhibitor
MKVKKTKIIIVDGERIVTEKMLHNLFKKELNFPEYYGMNLYALWDFITGHAELPIKVIWKNFEISKEKLGENFVECLMRLFDRAKKDLGKDFDYEIR